MRAAVMDGGAPAAWISEVTLVKGPNPLSEETHRRRRDHDERNAEDNSKHR